jgi:hypothetical protein
MNRSSLHIFALAFCTFCCISCSRNIPIVNDVDHFHLSPKGAYIEAKINGLREKLNISGELIVADKKKIIIYTLGKSRTMQPYALKDVISYQIYFAKGVENYDFETGLINASTLTHGWFLVLTLPINLLINGSINESVHRELRFDAKEVPLDELYKYARYPNGLPRGIDINNLNLLLED